MVGQIKRPISNPTLEQGLESNNKRMSKESERFTASPGIPLGPQRDTSLMTPSHDEQDMGPSPSPGPEQLLVITGRAGVPLIITRNATNASNYTASTLSSGALLPLSEEDSAPVSNASRRGTADLSGHGASAMADGHHIIDGGGRYILVAANSRTDGVERSLSEFSLANSDASHEGPFNDSFDGRMYSTGTTGGVSVGNWGWFEDVHNEITNSPMHRMGKDRRDILEGDQESGANDKDRRGGRKGKRGGLLHFTSSNVKLLNDSRPSRQGEGKWFFIFAILFALIGRLWRCMQLVVLTEKGLVTFSCLLENFLALYESI